MVNIYCTVLSNLITIDMLFDEFYKFMRFTI